VGAAGCGGGATHGPQAAGAGRAGYAGLRAEELFKDGKVSGAGEYLDGERHGRWMFYFRNGRPKADAGYHHGQLDGDCVWHREGGGLLQRGTFREGQQDGFWQRRRSRGPSYRARSTRFSSQTGSADS
jgi:antitoxin component YwqK of YwqJK toxin-antitoxin module